MIPYVALDDTLDQLENAKGSVETLDCIASIYRNHLYASTMITTVQHVEFLSNKHYLEKNVWPVVSTALSASSSDRHAWLMTVLLLVNDRMQKATPSTVRDIWKINNSDDAEGVWSDVITSLLEDSYDGLTSHKNSSNTWTIREKSILAQFLIHVYANTDVDYIAKHFLQLIEVPLWQGTLSAEQRALEFAQAPKLERQYGKFVAEMEATDEPPAKKQRHASKEENGIRHYPSMWIPAVLDDFVRVLTNEEQNGSVVERAQYVAVMVALWTDLLRQVPTRRFLSVVLRRRHILTYVRKSRFIEQLPDTIITSMDIAMLTTQIEQFERVWYFPLDVHTGKSLLTTLERHEALSKHTQGFQRCVFEHFRETSLVSLSTVPTSSILDRDYLQKQLMVVVLENRQLVEELGRKLSVFGETTKGIDDDILVGCIVDEYAPPSNALEPSRQLLPTELKIWSDRLVATATSSTATSVFSTSSTLFPLLPFSKLGLHYLHLMDFLERNQELVAAESTQTIRQDLEAAIRAVDAVRSLKHNGETIFRGFAPMAVPLLTAFSVMRVEKPKVGEVVPGRVLAQFDVELDHRHDVAEFDRMAQLDIKQVVYLVTLRPINDEAAEAIGYNQDSDRVELPSDFAEMHGVMHVRIAEVVDVLDENENSINEHTSKSGRGRKRTVQVALDGVQYKKDIDEGHDAYDYVNLLVLRDQKRNLFKAVLDVIKDCLHGCGATTSKLYDTSLPMWLNDLFLGYGDATAAKYDVIAKRKFQSKIEIPLIADLFTDATQAVELLSQDSNGFVLVDNDGKLPLAPTEAVGPFTLIEELTGTNAKVLKAHRGVQTNSTTPDIHLTKSQVQVVLQGTCEGLTIVSSPRDTSRQHALVQLVRNVYYSDHTSTDKILIIANTNKAVKDTITELQHRVDEAAIVTFCEDSSMNEFHETGRVDFLLQRRMSYLAEVDSLTKWMERKDATKYGGMSGSASYSCENALFFYRYYIKALIDEAKQTDASHAKETLLYDYYRQKQQITTVDVNAYHIFAQQVDGLFGELHRLQSLELLQASRQRREMYLMQHARIIVMTANDVAGQYQRFLDLKLKWSSVIFDEAEHIHEINTFIPLFLASQSNRIVLFGDATSPPQQPQLKPLVALHHYAHMNTTLFHRLLRLGFPSITLDTQSSQPTEPKTDKKTRKTNQVKNKTPTPKKKRGSRS